MTTLKDIAERTGLSVNTVSLALRESPRISEDTRKKVRIAARDLDYTPNHAAKSLVSRRTMTVGLLLTDVTSPVLTQVARSVELTLKERGYVTLLAASNADPEEERRALATFRSRQVDGVLVYPHNCEEIDHIARLRDGGLPVVMLSGPEAPPVDLVCIDEKLGAERAAQHLIGLGHRRIGLIDGLANNRNRQKSDGYDAALAAAGLPIDPSLKVDPNGSGPGNGHDAIARLMDQDSPPTAVITSTDMLALGVLKWCQSNGVSVPEDLAIVGFDNVEFGPYARVPLSSVDYPVGDVAEQAVARLLALIEDGPAEPQSVRIRPQLIVRESSRPHPPA